MKAVVLDVVFNTPLRSIAVTFVVATGLAAETPARPPSLAETDRAVDNLRQISRELTASQRRFDTHLSQTIARHDRGYRLENGAQVSGADLDLSSGPADLMWAAVQKFTLFRMLAARNEKYEPAPVADLDHIQDLIVEARKRVDSATAILRRLLVVSAVELDRNKDAAIKARRDQLIKARAETEAVARRALSIFPLEQQAPCSQNETVQSMWDRLRPPPKDDVKKTPQAAPLLPIRFERRKRVTLIDEASYRMAVTDSGIEDAEGRHIFYQEEWVQRGASVLRFRWRVAVETASGQHILLKRYTPVELHGDLEDLYNHRDRDYLWYLEPPDDSTEPSRDELESALAAVARSSEAIRARARDFATSIGEALAQQDRLHAAANQPPVDSGLPDRMRQKLFAIRAHLARVPGVLQLEGTVRGTISQAEVAIRSLEPLAAWSNRPAQPASLQKAALMDRSDWAIDAVRIAETEALKTLPPDSSRDEDSFPAFERNMIVRIRRAPSRSPQEPAVKCLQEIWRIESGMLGYREVRRTVSLILIDPQTGNQTRVGGAVRYYKASPEDALEEVFDEYASDEVSLGS